MNIYLFILITIITYVNMTNLVKYIVKHYYKYFKPLYYLKTRFKKN